MRVTTRRLQAALELASRAPGGEFGKARRKLRRWRRLLSRVRNYDVFLMLIESDAASRKSPAASAGIDTLKRELQARRADRCQLVRRRFSKIDMPAFAASIGITLATASDDVEAAVEGPAVGAPIDGASGADAVSKADAEAFGLEAAAATSDSEHTNPGLVVGERAPGCLDHRLSQFQALAALAREHPDPLSAHRVRIAAKRLRYLIEVVSELGFGDAAAALNSLKILQDRLGDWHDLAALESEIVDTVSKKKFLVKHLDESLGMIQLASRLRRKREALGSKSFPVHVPRSVPAVTRRLGRALRRETAV
jgi:CHAD domain-containing protein